MSNFLTVGFDFEDSFYYSVILVIENGDEKQYKITVMNGPLQLLLMGNNTIIEKNGMLDLNLPEGEKNKDLKLKIAEALALLLHLPIHTT